MKINIFSILIIFFINISCNSNSIERLIVGCWVSEKGDKIRFCKNGDYILIGKSTSWNYKFNGEKLYIYNTPFDDSFKDKHINIMHIDEAQLVWYDSLWSIKQKFNRIECD